MTKRPEPNPLVMLNLFQHLVGFFLLSADASFIPVPAYRRQAQEGAFRCDFNKWFKVSMSIKEILLLGNPKLYEISEPLKREELPALAPIIQDLHDTLIHFREQHGAGRAIAAVQIGVMKRLIYMHIDRPIIFINPVLDQKSEKMIAIWDDCICFPDLLVKVERHRSCRIAYRDMEWEERTIMLEGDLSELLQHECDHLDGILAVSRAIDPFSFALKSQKNFYHAKSV